jgi:geranylgeranyl reductase family protein
MAKSRKGPGVEHYDAVIIGGGPAGSTCAWRLHRAGLRAAVVDRAVFPRDKVCAGWITPPVIALLDLDVAHYRRGRVFQPISGFQTGLMGGATVRTSYEAPVSFGIRRCEFDHYLLQRCGAELRCGKPVTTIRRTNDAWIVNDAVSAPVIVGAGGHYCPVARRLNPPAREADVVAAVELEVPLDDRQTASDVGGAPILRFFDDLSGYAWCFRKETVLNVGLGRLHARNLPHQARDFLNSLIDEHLVPGDIPPSFRGHAYLLAGSGTRECIHDGLVLAGDAAGLADSHSGEGIRPAIESGLLAAEALLAADGRYDRARLEPYRRQLRARFGAGTPAAGWGRWRVPTWAVRALAKHTLRSRWVTRHFLLDRWFLGRHRPALTAT